MDYTLAALKLFCCQLHGARATAAAAAAAAAASSASSVMSLFGIRFQRAWLQGVLLPGSGEGHFLLDDGSGVIELLLSQEAHEWKIGMYVMVVGPYIAPRSNGYPAIKVHKIVDLSESPDREAMWHLEVIEAYKLLYLPSHD